MEVSTSRPTQQTKRLTNHGQVQHAEEEQLRSSRRMHDKRTPTTEHNFKINHMNNHPNILTWVSRLRKSRTGRQLITQTYDITIFKITFTKVYRPDGQRSIWTISFLTQKGRALSITS